MTYHTKPVEVYNDSVEEKVVNDQYHEMMNKESQHQQSGGSGCILYKCNDY